MVGCAQTVLRENEMMGREDTAAIKLGPVKTEA